MSQEGHCSVRNLSTTFNPIQTGVGRGGGGRRILPAATLNVNSSFNIETNATKLGDFF